MRIAYTHQIDCDYNMRTAYTHQIDFDYNMVFVNESHYVGLHLPRFQNLIPVYICHQKYGDFFTKEQNL